MKDIHDLLKEAGLDPSNLGEVITIPDFIEQEDKPVGMFLVWNKQGEWQIMATDPAHAVNKCNDRHDLALPVRVTNGNAVWLVSGTDEAPVMSDCPQQNIPHSESSMMMQRQHGNNVDVQRWVDKTK